MIFQYKARGAKEVYKGEIEANNIQEAYLKLKKQGVAIIQIKEKPSFGKFSLSFLRKISLKDLAIFTKQLEIMIKAGLSLVSALEAQAQQTENKKLAKIALRLSEMIKGGGSLSEALSRYPSVFSPLYIGTVRSGEKSGALEQVFSSLAEQYERDYELSAKIKGAMVYPAFILTALFVVIILMLIYVVPSLNKLFKELGGQLPMATKVLISASGFVLKFWWLILFIFLGIFLLLYFLGKTKKGKQFIDFFKIKLPVFGNLLKKIYIARFARTSATLIGAGLAITEVFETVKGVVPNVLYQNQIEKIKEEVEGGVTLSSAIKKADLFPPMLSNLLSAGELTGNIKESFETVADYYEKEVTRITASLSSLIEPILITIIGLAVGIAVVSIIKPIYSLSEML